MPRLCERFGFARKGKRLVVAKSLPSSGAVRLSAKLFEPKRSVLTGEDIDALRAVGALYRDEHVAAHASATGRLMYDTLP